MVTLPSGTRQCHGGGAGRAAQIRLLVSGERGPGSFPAPAALAAGRNRLWRWSEVTSWAAERLGVAAGPDPGSSAVGAVNALLALRLHHAQITDAEAALLEQAVRRVG